MQHAEPDLDAERKQTLLRRADELAERVTHPLGQLLKALLAADDGINRYGRHGGSSFVSMDLVRARHGRNTTGRGGRTATSSSTRYGTTSAGKVMEANGCPCHSPRDNQVLGSNRRWCGGPFAALSERKETRMTRLRRLQVATLVLVVAVGLGGIAFAATRTGERKAGPEETVAFAHVLSDGTIRPDNSSDNIADSNISHTADSGVYCFTDLPFLPSNAVVAGNNAFGFNDTLASVVLDIATPREGLSGCPEGATIRVRTLDLNGGEGFGGPYNPQLMDRRFMIWIRGDRP
jgi:hypothetical protein